MDNQNEQKTVSYLMLIDQLVELFNLLTKEEIDGLIKVLESYCAGVNAKHENR